MNLTLITYDTAHEKTERVFWHLKNSKTHELSFLFVPFVERPKRKTLFEHRPQQFNGVPIRSIASGCNAQVYEYEERFKALESDYLLICGANLLEEKFAKSGKIINCHSGLIPNSRGLDSFKWAIKENKKVGNTLHIIDEEADSGQLLHHLETPVYTEDTLSTFAYRHYQNEIWLLQHFDLFLESGTVKNFTSNEPTKRMPLDIEASLSECFELYKKTYCEKMEALGGRNAT